MFSAFTRPNRLVLALTAFVTASFIPWGRFYVGDGELWTILGLAITFAAFAATASHYPALAQLGLPARRWLTHASGLGVLWTVTAASLTTWAGVLMHRGSVYYAWYDWFLVTSGDAATHDTNGEPYVVTGLGLTGGSVTWTWVVLATGYATAVIAGLGFGIARNRIAVIACAAASVVAGVAVTVATQYWQFVHGDPAFPLDGPTRFLILLGLAAVPVGSSLVLLWREILGRKPSQLHSVPGAALPATVEVG